MDSFTGDLNSPLLMQMQSEMTDDGRPSSLLANDCAASNARRIEGRPAIALPSSERPGEIILKRGKVVNSEDPFRNLSDHILEHILAKLSLFPLKTSKSVCKRWASVTSTPEFNILRKELNPKSCLVRCAMSRRNPSKLVCVAYDVENNAWVTLPALQLPAHNYDYVTGASGVLFAFLASKNRLLYKLTTSLAWYKTPVMTSPRHLPVVDVALGAGMGHKVVVAGGWVFGETPRSRHSVVEVFDSETGTWDWESYGDMPELSEFNNIIHISGVVCNNKFYVSSVYKEKSGHIKIHSLDFYTKQWTSIQLECPMGLFYSHPLSIGTTLVVARIYLGEINVVHLWKVDLKTLSLIQIGLMPRELATLFDKREPLMILSNENLVCIFMFMKPQHILAEVSLEECKTCWHLLPVDPLSAVYLFGRFTTSFPFISSV